MGDILAIISKAQFEAAHKNAKVGEKLNFTVYVSTHAALEPVRGGGSIFLVTVRPPDERLWLLAELVNPKHDGKQWKSAASSLAVNDVTDALPKLKFVNGKGIAPKKGALGMSLQTPRQLTTEDSALLRGGKSAAPAPKAEAPAKAEQPKAAPAAEAPPPKVSTSLTLASVLARWRTTRAPELEELIITLGKHHARAFAPLDPEADDYDAQWNAREKEATPESLDTLLPGLWSDPRGSIPMRIRQLLDLGPDPRLGEGFLKMIDEPPLTASSNFSAWTTLFKALPTLIDTRSTKRLQARTKKKGGDSQFWPKLNGWIETALGQLQEPAKLSKEEAADVARLQKEANALLKGPPPSGAVAKKEKPSAAVMKGSPREALEEALKAADAGKPLEALEPLRQYWVATRLPEVAALMTTFARLGRSTQPDFSSGKRAELHMRWLDNGKKFDARLVTPLLEALLEGALADTEERLEVMLNWPADPRVAEAMVDRCIFGRDPYIGARPQLWKRAYDNLVVHADPRFVDRLEKNAARLENAAAFDRNRAERPHATRTIGPYRDASKVGRAASADEKKLLEQLTALGKKSADQKKAAAKPDQELALLKAINAAAPDDTSPYMVYADFLAERGDPRAELINLSLAFERGEKVKSKLEKWVKENEKALLGNLKMRIYKPLDRLKRGFFPSLGMDPWGKIGDADLEPMAEDLRWVTAKTVSLPYEPKAHADFLLSKAPLYGMETLEHASSHYLEVMCARDFDWPVKVISLGGDQGLSLSSKVKPSAFPKLEELHFTFWKADFDTAFFEHPLVKVCKRLSTGDPKDVTNRAMDVLIPLFAKLPKLETFTSLSRALHATFTATGDGRFDLVLDVGAINPKNDAEFNGTLASFKKLDAKFIRSFKLGELPEVRGYSQPNPESTALAKAATKHLG
ncbi:MAG: TIGR02996 domain-containing protein [Archangium sp.]|nr:TIGR02996 domain-containing protein [Archangium sp.]